MMRSRLQRIQEKRDMRRATLTIFLTIAIIAVAAVVGIPVLTRIAILFSNINSSNRPIVSNDTIPPVSPQIVLPYDATSSAQQKISGMAEPGSSVFLTHNSNSLGDVVADDSGEFQFSGIYLDEGENVFSAVAIDQAGNKSLNSSEVRLFYSTKQPKLEIESPQDRQEINKTSVEIKGETDPGVRLSVNDRTIIVNSSGRFSALFNLNGGENVLVFVAVDRTGNQTRRELTVNSTP